MAINPLAYTEKVIRSFLRYQLTTYPFADERLNAQMRKLLSLDETRDTPLLKGPYVSLSRAFESGASIEDLISDGVLHPHLSHLVPFPAVYGHQEEAIRAIARGRTTLISTGTGSGKSECFLYPIISRCLELRDEDAEPGICAVIVYPMNALAEDQLGRLRELLAGSGITFGMYVGKTPEREADVTGKRLAPGSSHADFVGEADRLRGIGDPSLVHPPEERCSREAMRQAGQQPRILLTNVQQLELLLTRQQDVELFDGTRLDFLVFDEAHTFRGALGAESACLVRRLRSFCGRDRNDTVCIATSATIVDAENPDAARDFASRFFGVSRDHIAAVNERYEPDVWAETRTVPAAPANPDAALESVRLAVDHTDDGASLRKAWETVTGSALSEGDVEEALHDALAANELLYQVGQILERPRALIDLVAGLEERVGRSVSEAELILWLTLGAAARKDGRPLVRPVVHGFVRGVPGAVVTFDPDAETPELHLSAEDDEEEDERLRMKVSTCTTCGQHYFEHSLADFEYTGKVPGGGNAAGDTGTYWEPQDEAHGGVRVLFIDRLISQEEDEDPEGDKITGLYLCRACGTTHVEPGVRCCGCGSQGELLCLYAIRQNEKNPGHLPTCVCCGAFGRTYAGRFREPAKPVRATNVADVHVLGQDMVHHADRERLLVFADNRQDAAFQAGWMRDHARRFRLRSLMLRALEGGALSIGDLAHKLNDALEADEALSRALVPEVWAYAPKESGGRRHREERLYFLRIQVLLEITMSPRQQVGLEPWGRIKINYGGLEESDRFVQEWARGLRLPADELLGGIQGILDHIRRRKQLFDGVGHIFSKTWGFGERELENGFLPELRGVPKGLKLRREFSDEQRWVDQWLSDGHLTTVKEIAGKWGVPAHRVDDFVTALWQYLSESGRALLQPVTLKGSHGRSLPNCHGTHQVHGDKIMIATNASGAYRCRTCRRRSIRRTPHMKCLAWHCDGELEHVPEDPDNYDLQLIEEQYTMLRPREHTAMVPTAEREKLEQIFKSDSNAINALVCTQTLELGVDIGALDAVLMRNVPPMPANYWQRVGRAGRRHRMAVNLTYCRQVNHDRAYFAEPLKMLGGRVAPPSFNLANELMVAKHVHATVITTLHQMTRRGSPLGEGDQQLIEDALRTCLPRFVSAYVFDEEGARRLAPFDVIALSEGIRVGRAAIDTAVQQAFAQGWPERDGAVVSPEALAAHVSNMAASLQEVVTRLFRRLRWAHQQMENLERIRGRYGALDDEQDAFYNRCKRYVRKMKGTRTRRRQDTEGVDDIVTYGVLAAEGFLPGYGLETGNVVGMAQVPRSVVGLDDFDLPRPSAVALREYVPGNLIYANGQRFVARRYYRDVGEDRAEEIRFEVSPEHEAIHEVRGHATGDTSSSEITSIPICDVILLHQSRISDEEENRFQMGVAVYGRELGQHSGGQAYRWGEKAVQLRKGVRMQLVNVGATSVIRGRGEFGYPVCRVCGQSVSPFSSDRQRDDFRTKHEEQCGLTPGNVAFHADLAVDTLTVPACATREEAYSLAEAIRFAAAELLEMELRDLQVLVIGHHDSDDVDAHLYDPMPGGSGLLEQIRARFTEVVQRAREMAEDCPGLCENSCIDCFQNYRNAFYHKHLDRHLMKERLTDLGDRLVWTHEISPRQPSPGAFCVRPMLAKEYQEHPFRLSYPLKRKGARGANEWQQIPWDQALDEIADKLADIRERHGAEAVATSSGTGRGGAEFAKTRFMNLFGSPNRFGVITICYAPRAMVWFSTFGGHLVPDRRAGKTRMMVLWGRNPHEGGPSSWNSFQKARKAGMKTMVIDPRCTEPARQADRWVQVRPGTDTLLALAMMHVIIAEDLHDKAFVAEHTHGFAQLAERVKAYSPESVAQKVGLSADTIRDMARFYATHQPSTMVIGVAAEHCAPNSIQAIRAINLLRAIVGSVDVEGGDLIAGPCPGFLPDVVMEANEALAPEQRRKQIGSDRFRFMGYPGWELIEKQMRRVWGERHSAAVNLHSCAHAPSVFRAALTGKPYPVKAFLVSCSNPLLSYANTTLVYRALKAAELLVTFDITWTPTAAISDYVLPAACWMERPDMGNFSSVGGYPLIQLGEAAVPARVPGSYERLNDYEFWRELGIRLGQQFDWPWPTFEDLWAFRIAEIMEKRGNATFEEFVHSKRWELEKPTPGRCRQPGLATPTGKVELYSTILDELGYDPLPAYVEPTITPDVRKRYPLLNISGVRTMPYHHSEFRHVDGFRKRQPDPIVEIHVDLARRKGIVDGDWVWIESPIGRIRQRARLSTAFSPDYVVTQHGWWFPEQPAAEPSLYGLWQSNINVTTDDDPEMCDALSGAWPLKGEYLRCRIEKAEPPGEGPDGAGSCPDHSA